MAGIHVGDGHRLRAGGAFHTLGGHQARELDTLANTFDPFRSYADADRSELPGDTVTILDAFYVVKLAAIAMDDNTRPT